MSQVESTSRFLFSLALIFSFFFFLLPLLQILLHCRCKRCTERDERAALCHLSGPQKCWRAVDLGRKSADATLA